MLVQRVVPPVAQYQARTLGWKAPMLAGLGRWREASLVADTLARYDAGKAMDIRVWSVVLGLAPADTRKTVDSAVASFPLGGESEYAHAMVDLLRGRVDEGRKRIARTLAARDAPQIPQDIHGLLVAPDGFGLLLQGDTTAGISKKPALHCRSSAASDRDRVGCDRSQRPRLNHQGSAIARNMSAAPSSATFLWN